MLKAADVLARPLSFFSADSCWSRDVGIQLSLLFFSLLLTFPHLLFHPFAKNR